MYYQSGVYIKWEAKMSEDNSVSALGLLDFLRLADKELIDKILAVAKTVKVEKLEGGITRISIDLVEQR